MGQRPGGKDTDITTSICKKCQYKMYLKIPKTKLKRIIGMWLYCYWEMALLITLLLGVLGYSGWQLLQVMLRK